MKLPRVSPKRAVHLFAALNIVFLGGDIAVAHAANAFARPVEWAPVAFSAIAALLLAPGALGAKSPIFAAFDRMIAACAVMVGTAGMVLHLDSAFFERQTLQTLVYSAPFVAPLSYVGVGLLLFLVRSDEADTPAFGPWVLLLALGGFFGNFALSLLDHAQNGFFRATEWVPVIAAAFAVGFLLVAVARPSRPLLSACTAVMALQAVVGVAGFILHVGADVEHRSAPLFDRFVFGAPAFAPLLFANLALLAILGIWASRAQTT